MGHDLVIQRDVTIAGRPVLDQVPALPWDERVAAFRRQGEIFCTSQVYKRANDAMLGVVESHDAQAHKNVTADPHDVNQPDIFYEADSEKYRTLVSLSPYHKINCKLNGTNWVIRTRASMTGCALQTGGRLSRLWLTIEGIPVETRAPNAEALGFLEVAGAMKKAAESFFHQAYEDSLTEITKQPARFEPGQRIAIRMADSDLGSTGALLSEVYFGRTSLASIKTGATQNLAEARQGLALLKEFVDAASGLQANIETLTVNNAVDLAKGLICRGEDPERHTTHIAGFARRAGGGAGFHVPNQLRPTESYLRTVSPSRAISAWLGHHEAQPFATPSLQAA
jgi:hypothetical protein